MLTQKVNTWLSMILLASLALWSSMTIIDVSNSEDFTFANVDTVNVAHSIK